MFTKWYKSWIRTVSGPNMEAADGVGLVTTVVNTARDVSVSQVVSDEQDPIFEGGGQVLLGRPYWEKAGWGVVLVFALMPCL